MTALKLTKTHRRTVFVYTMHIFELVIVLKLISDCLGFSVLFRWSIWVVSENHNGNKITYIRQQTIFTSALRSLRHGAIISTSVQVHLHILCITAHKKKPWPQLPRGQFFLWGQPPGPLPRWRRHCIVQADSTHRSPNYI